MGRNVSVLTVLVRVQEDCLRSILRLKPVYAIRFRTSSTRLRLKCDGTRAETRFCLSTKRTSPFKSAAASVQSTNGGRGVCISGSNAGYTNFRGSVKGTGYPLHSPVFPSLPLPCVIVCNHISTGVYYLRLIYINVLQYCLS